MSTPDDAPKPTINPEPATPAADAAQDAAADMAAEVRRSANDEAMAEAIADAMDAPAEPGDEADLGAGTGWGQGTIAALRAKLGGDKNADAVADEITKLVDENADLKDRLLRSVAEMDNLRKRTDREKADTAKYAVSRFAEDMLRVGDNMGRALEAVPEDIADKDAGLKSLRDGIAMTSIELLKGLQKHGVLSDEPKGEKFDPNKHQAIAEIEDPNVPAGHVAEVFQIGYMISDRVLRPAMVVVSKGPGQPAPTAAATAAPVATAEPAPAANNTPPPASEPPAEG